LDGAGELPPRVVARKLGDLVGGSGCEVTCLNALLQVVRQVKQGKRPGDLRRRDPQRVCELLAGPGVEREELAKGLRLLERPEVLTQEVLDELLGEELAAGELALDEHAVDGGKPRLARRPPAAFADDDHPLPERPRPAHADGSELTPLPDAG